MDFFFLPPAHTFTVKLLAKKERKAMFFRLSTSSRKRHAIDSNFKRCPIAMEPFMSRILKKMSVRHLDTHNKGIFAGLSGFIRQRKEKSFAQLDFLQFRFFLCPRQRDKIESMIEGAKRRRKKYRWEKRSRKSEK